MDAKKVAHVRLETVEASSNKNEEANRIGCLQGKGVRMGKYKEEILENRM